jgi:hypothetical protein
LRQTIQFPGVAAAPSRFTQVFRELAYHTHMEFLDWKRIGAFFIGKKRAGAVGNSSLQRKSRVFVFLEKTAGKGPAHFSLCEHFSTG